MAITLPDNFGLVGIPLFTAWLVNFWMGAKVMGARKKYGVDYPNMYAVEGMKVKITNADKKEETVAITKENADAFNNYQRAHQNFLENLPLFSVMTLFGAVYNPVHASCLAGFWLLARVVYNLGYSTKGANGRIVGALSGLLGQLVLSVSCLVVGVKALDLF